MRRTTDEKSLEMAPAAGKITLRHLLSHTSGLSSEDHPLVHEYLNSDVTKLEFEEDAHTIVKLFLFPRIRAGGRLRVRP